MKRTIKKLALAVMLAGGLVVGFGGLAFAGGGHKGHGEMGARMFKKLDGMSEQERLEFMEDMLDKRVARMTDKLELSKAQQVKVRQIMADAQTQMLEIYEQNKNVQDKTAAKGEAKAVMKQARQDVGDVLTDDQKAKIKAQHAEKRGERKAKMLNRLDEKLELSDAQRAKVEKIFDGSHEKMKALKDQNLDEDARRAAAKKIKTGAADEINGVLTKEQQVKWAEMRKRFEDGPRKGKRGKGKRRGAF